MRWGLYERERDRELAQGRLIGIEGRDDHTFLLLLDTTSLGLGCCFGAGLGHGFGGGFRFGVSRCLGSFWWHLD